MLCTAQGRQLNNGCGSRRRLVEHDRRLSLDLVDGAAAGHDIQNQGRRSYANSSNRITTRGLIKDYRLAGLPAICKRV